jgi:hypothetical protein
MNSISRMPPGPSLTLSQHVLLRHFLANLRVQIAHRVDRAEVEVFAENKGAAHGLQLVKPLTRQGAALIQA